ncbi:calcineurin-like phosphoesterase [Aspergillus indologenus CBS 114.80]|uniref:Calcineurin-like phosphoesterase n=1 Tax=Aspergillus indologenus CBS 114.80 TaxID=1450541 RepID=A0A2V5IA31_9EURO|nr:calcineurin-like phosphoesterase [Aspergillus indologenus CBS 114.80]
MFQKVRALFSPPSSSCSFQVLSDLHLEINQQYLSYEIPACADHLILAGDIGRLADYEHYRAFLQRHTDRFQVVLLILGNHEFYNMSFASGLAKARQLEQEPCLHGRLIVLHRNRYDVPGSRVSVLGCTLWSHVPDDARAIVQAKIQDFRKIPGWTVDAHNAAHAADLAWLQTEIQSIRRENRGQPSARSLLVLTHHAPSLNGTSAPQHALNPWRFAFGTEILAKTSEGVSVWVFGHTHHSTEFKAGSVRVVSNQRGYVLPWSNPTAEANFDVRRVIRIS